MESNSQMTELQNEIRRRYEVLSKRLKQVARYILDNSNNVALLTATEIAERAHVTPSTLIRFASEFGFDGFNEMKQIFRSNLMEQTASYTERAKLLRTTVNDADSQPESPEEILQVFSLVNRQALQQLVNDTEKEKLKLALDLLKNADNIYIVGFRRSFNLATYLTYALYHLEKKTHLVDGFGGMHLEQMNALTAKDVVFVISVSPYAQEALDLIEIANKKGARQITLTDSKVSPFTAFSDVSFVIKEAQLNGFRSQISSICLIQSLVISLALDSTKSNNDQNNQ